MPSTYTHLRYHIIFGTKLRQPWILPAWEERLYRYIGGIISDLDCVLLEINGIQDHVHLLASLRAVTSVANLLHAIKGGSSRWVNEEKLVDGTFAWQEGYAAFTVSQSQVEATRRYIRKQKEHHRDRTFEDELEDILKLHGMVLDKEHFAQ